jgi:hypothetical protein
MTKLKAIVVAALVMALAMAWPTTGIAGSTLSYLIVTNDELKPAFTELATYREAMFGQGKTAVVTVPEIQNAVKEGDLPERILTYLTSKYKNEGLQYVLLGGDDTVVPVKIQQYLEQQIPFDGYYSMIDDKYTIIVGRLPVRTSQQASSYVAKLKTYETEGTRKTAGKVFLSGAKIEGNFSGTERGRDMVNDGMSQFQAHSPVSDAETWVRRVYRDGVMVHSPSDELKGLFDTVSSWDGDQPGSYSITGGRLLEKLNQAWELAIHYSVGDVSSLIFDSTSGNRFTTDQAGAMSGLVCSFISASGYGGAFDDAKDPCLAEGLLRNPNGGALVYIGSSRNAPIGAQDLYGGGFSYIVRYYHQLLLSGSSATYGEALIKAKAYLLEMMAGPQFPEDVTSQIHFYNYALNFLGDPAIPAPSPVAWLGSMTRVKTKDVEDLGETFWATPSAKTLGIVWEKPVSSRLKAVSKIQKGVDITSGKPAISALFEGQPQPKLWDKQTTLANVEAGEPVPEALVRRGLVEMDLHVSVATESGKRLRDASAGTVRGVRPVIQSVTWDSALKEGTQVIVGGAFFGKKTPEVYFERIRAGKRVWVPSKVMPFYPYPDAYGKVFSSVTDPSDGEAIVCCVYPGLGQDETDTGWLILASETGIDAFQFILMK